MVWKAFVLLAFWACPASAIAFTASISAECTEGHIFLNVSVQNPNPPTHPNPFIYGGYVVVRYAIGTCEEPVQLSEYAIDFSEDSEFVDTPSSLATPYIYTIHTLDLLGNLGDQVIGNDKAVSVSCGGKPIFRGTIDGYGF